MKTNEELKQLLRELKTKRLISLFCSNELGTYEGNWEPTHISHLLSGKREGNVHYNKALVMDIKGFLKKVKEK